MARKSLTTGFTGDVHNARNVSTQVKSAISTAKNEAGMVAAHAVDHPVATGSAAFVFGLLGLTVGYLLGVSSANRSHRPY